MNMTAAQTQSDSNRAQADAGSMAEAGKSFMGGAQQVAEMLIQFMSQQAERDNAQSQQIAALTQAIAKPKQISGSMPSGRPFNVTVQ
jgi:HPt (histidine-containing phosphotransfer) domain-containing protein